MWSQSHPASIMRLHSAARFDKSLCPLATLQDSSLSVCPSRNVDKKPAATEGIGRQIGIVQAVLDVRRALTAR